MKRLPLVVAAVLILVLGVIGCAQTPQYKPYVPKYTADQVIAVVRASYPVGYTRSYPQTTTPTIISVRYIGGTRAAWQAQISLPSRYYLQGGLSSKTLYFYETAGSLRDTYDP